MKFRIAIAISVLLIAATAAVVLIWTNMSTAREGGADLVLKNEPAEIAWPLLLKGDDENFWKGIDAIKTQTLSGNPPLYTSSEGVEQTGIVDKETIAIGNYSFELDSQTIRQWRRELSEGVAKNYPGNEREVFIRLDGLLRGVMLNNKTIRSSTQYHLAGILRAAMLDEMLKHVSSDDPYNPRHKRDAIMELLKSIAENFDSQFRLVESDIP